MLVKDLIKVCRNIHYRTNLILKVGDKTLYAGQFKDIPYYFVFYNFKSFEVTDIGVEIVLG